MTARATVPMHSALTIGWRAFQAAWRTRDATRDDRLARLLEAPAPSNDGGDRRDARRAARGALFVLRQLAKLPGAEWRDTCLYRAIAECLALRAFGFPAVVRLGVRGASHEPVSAHAWTECIGIECLTSAHDVDARYVRLQ